MTLGPKGRLGYAALRVMEGRLKDRGFFVGDRYSITDMVLHAHTRAAHEDGLDLGRFPRVRAWLQRVAAQPGHTSLTQS